MNVEILREQERVKYEWLNRNTDYGNANHAKGRIDEIVEVLEEYNVKSILDAGTGKGRFCKMIEERTNIKKIYGLDIAMDPGFSETDRISFIKSGAHNIPLDEKVDCITSFDFFEHVVTDDVDIILGEMDRICGKLMIHKIHYTTPGHPGHSTSHREVVGELHQTLRPIEWWLAKFNQYGDASFQEDIRLFVVMTDNT
jgi:ubiquinone/menaquinone biosynthesis C-methylase UbiE